MFSLGIFALPTKALIIETTRTFSSLSYDGYIYMAYNTYGFARNYTSGTVDAVTGQFLIGQRYTGSLYYLFRGYLYFDTSIIPDSATITNVTLSLYVAVNSSDTDFNVTIQNGQPTYPHIPLEAGDYYYTYYSGDGGNRNTTEITSLDYWNITLNNDGEGWISKTTTTKLCLRSNNDIGNTAPTGDEYLNFYTYEHGEAYSPKLYVTYSFDGYIYLVHGPYYESGAVALVNVSLTIELENMPSETYFLNGSDGTADSFNITTEQRGIFLNWNITTPTYNRTRAYYLSSYSFEEVWIYLPSATEPTYLYTFTVTDFLGVTNAYLETVKNVAGQNRIIERQRLDLVNAIPFWLAWGSRYDIRITCDQGSYTWGGFLALTEQEVNLIISQGMFPTTYPGLNITLNAARMNATWIQFNYTDLDAETTWIYCAVKHRSGTTWYTDYTSNTTANTVTVNWYSAVNTTSYIGEITALRSGVQKTWKFNLPTLWVSTSIWAGLLDALGVWPVPSENIIGFIITLMVFAVFSYFHAKVGIIIGVMTAAFLTVIGWLNISWTLIGLAFTVAMFGVIAQTKKEEREL